MRAARAEAAIGRAGVAETRLKPKAPPAQPAVPSRRRPPAPTGPAD